jgi:hypothetical protein
MVADFTRFGRGLLTRSLHGQNKTYVLSPAYFLLLFLLGVRAY